MSRMKNTLGMTVHLMVGCNLIDAVRDGCELAYKLGLACIKFKSCDQDFTCFHDGRVMKTDGKPGRYEAQVIYGDGGDGEKIDWVYFPTIDRCEWTA